MITSDRMREIIIARSFQVIPVKDTSTGTVRWVCKTIDGSRAAPSNSSYPTPEEAVEAADIHFSAAEQRETLRKSEAILSALDKGEYFIKPKDIPSIDPDREGDFTVRVFDVFDKDGNLTVVRNKPSVIDAVIEIEAERKKDELLSKDKSK